MAEKQSRIFTRRPMHERAGPRVTTLAELALLSEAKRSVICPKHPAWNRPRPAAWIIQLPGAMLLNMMECGMYVYEKGNTNG